MINLFITLLSTSGCVIAGLMALGVHKSVPTWRIVLGILFIWAGAAMLWDAA